MENSSTGTILLLRGTTDSRKVDLHSIFAFTFGILNVSVAVVCKHSDSFTLGEA